MTSNSHHTPSMTRTMAQASLSSQRRDEPDAFSMREWALRANVDRDDVKSRRHSASNIRRFGEEAKSFRSTTNVCSTVSSPGYTLRGEINPSSYSFTTALRALQQSRSGYGWEWLSPDGAALNSKWNDAEKYICNPLSGEFPMECLSAKTLSGRAFATIKTKTAICEPLASPSKEAYTKTKLSSMQCNEIRSPFQEKAENFTRDIGTQSSPRVGSSCSSSPLSTPSMRESCESSKTSSNSTFGTEVEMGKEVAGMEKGEQRHQVVRKCRQWECFVWKRLWVRKNKGDQKQVGGAFCFGRG